MADIHIRNAEKNFGSNKVINALNLRIHDGEFVVLLGPSGCGKTTTLRAIAGLETIDSGEILIGGRRVDHLPPQERDISFVFQLYSLYPHLTAFENIAFPLRAARVPDGEVKNKVQRVAEILQITHLLKKRPSALSGGDLQRVTLGRALVRQPEAILMDEPIGALDAKLRDEMRVELRRLHDDNGLTSVYVTHDQVEAMSMADKIGIMSEGILQQYASPLEVYNAPANLFVAQFIGSPVMNIVDCVVASVDGEPHVCIQGQRTALELGLQSRRKLQHHRGDALALGIRPEAITVSDHRVEGAVGGTVHLVEPMGPFDIVDFQLDSQGGHDVMLRARTDSQRFTQQGQTAWLSLDDARMHFFDKRSGLALQGER